MKTRLPNRSQRTTILGRTGTGKTVAGMWHLSLYPLDKMPFIVINYKGDEYIDSISRAEFVDVGFVPSKKDTGVFIAHPEPEADDKAVNLWLRKIWQRGNCGVFVDEALMVAKINSYNLMLTQGRSLKIPMISCSQRPRWISLFAFSEADFFQVFDITTEEDRKTVSGFVPIPRHEITEEGYTLPPFHSYWYDVAKKQLTKFSPVPHGDEILNRIDLLLKPKRKFI